jgi:peroxiredoxin Q/BCP
MFQVIRRTASVLGAATFLGLYSMTQLVFAVEVGDKMPDFSLPASDGNTYTLAEFHGKKPVVVAFFPKAFTPG